MVSVCSVPAVIVQTRSAVLSNVVVRLAVDHVLFASVIPPAV
jgi:hypothetical protein